MTNHPGDPYAFQKLAELRLREVSGLHLRPRYRRPGLDARHRFAGFLRAAARRLDPVPAAR